MCQEPTRISGDCSDYLGKRLLVGITVYAADGEFVYQEQYHGVIVYAGDDGLVVERNDTGARVSLPPELQQAPPGDYRLRSTGEVVVNPDYLAKWSFTEGDAEQMASGGPPAA